MGKKYNYDYIIIGGGPAGTTAAILLARAKKNVAIIEGTAIGGANLNTRDIPYALSLGFSHTFAGLARYPEIGGSTPHFNFPSVIAASDRIIKSLTAKTLTELKTAGVNIIPGFANFLDSHTVAVANKQFTARFFILATGAKLKTSEISGLDTVDYLTPDTAIKVRRLPKVAFVIGGGPTGCEIAEYYASLGAKVIIMELGPRLLPREDEEVGATIQSYFDKELGILSILNSKVVAIEQSGNVKNVIFTTGGREKMVRVDCVILATGSLPVTDYGLENAGVKYDKNGISVNKSLQTTAKNIYAIGDAIGKHSSTERAEYEASVLAINLTSRAKTILSYTGFVRRTDTFPAVATIGLNELDLVKRDRKYKKSIVYLKDLPAGIISRSPYGFVKILADTHSDRILGATIVAPDAALIAGEFSLALRHRLTTLALASTPHPSNSASLAVKLAARQLVSKTK